MPMDMVFGYVMASLPSFSCAAERGEGSSRERNEIDRAGMTKSRTRTASDGITAVASGVSGQ